MNPISICIIAKNEERTLDKCLSALKPMDCEIIFVDTGSTDSTKQIAKKYTNKIYDFTWTDDFSAARNFSISKASHDWILVIDCDEYVESFDMQQLLSFTHSNKESIGEITRHDLYGSSADNYTYTSHIERFFNKKYFSYSLPIHEQIVPISMCEYQTLPVSVSIFLNFQKFFHSNVKIGAYLLQHSNLHYFTPVFVSKISIRNGNIASCSLTYD